MPADVDALLGESGRAGVGTPVSGFTRIAVKRGLGIGSGAYRQSLAHHAGRLDHESFHDRRRLPGR